MRATRIVILSLALLAPGLGAAQAFPGEGAWFPLPCRGAAMSDGYQDEAGAIAERDIVGDASAAAGWRAADASFFYVRIRLDEDPAPGGALRPFSWGIELDSDGVLSTYEVLIIVRKGAAEEIALYRNTVTTLPDDPNDPADEPPVATYPFATHGRTVVAAGSSYGGDPDWFLEIAVPWSDLAKVGLGPATPLVAWAASSSSPSSLNGDFACHDGSTGAPTLSGIAPDPTVLDPTLDSDGDGWPDAVEVSSGTDPNDPASHPAGAPPTAVHDAVYQGGGGCAAGGGRAGLGAALATLAALAATSVAARRRRGERA